MGNCGIMDNLCLFALRLLFCFDACLLDETLCFIVLNTRDFDKECTSALVLTLYPDASTDCLGEASTEIETEPGTADFTSVGVVDAIKLLEKMRLVLAWDADTGVCDADNNMRLIASDIDNHLTLECIFDGVFDEVLDNFTEMTIVDVGLKYRIETLDRVLDGTLIRDWLVKNTKPLILGFWRKTFHDIMDKRYDIDDFWIVLETRVVCLADVEQVCK